MSHLCHREVLEFNTTHARDHDSTLGETATSVATNNRFKIEFFLPSVADGKKESHLVLMVNGFAEWNKDLYHHPDFGLATLFARRGFASVLLPIPFHFNRIPETPRYTKFSRRLAAQDGVKQEHPWYGMPAYIVRSNPERLYLGYRQIISDIVTLGEHVKGQENNAERASEFDHWFSKDTRIHLLGYSLGGLGCVAALLKRHKYVEARDREGRLFDSCALLCSGASLQNLVPTELKFTEEDWRIVTSYYTKREFQNEIELAENVLAQNRAKKSGNQTLVDKLERRISAEIKKDRRRARYRRNPAQRRKRLLEIRDDDQLSYPLFQRLVVGSGKEFDGELRSIVSVRIRDWLGEHDKGVPLDSLLGLERGVLKVEIIPGVKHRLIESKEWSCQAGKTVAQMATFMESCPPCD